MELKTLKEQEELQSCLENLGRETKQKEMEIAGLQGEVARKARFAEKEIKQRKYQVVVAPACEIFHQSSHQTTI